MELIIVGDVVGPLPEVRPEFSLQLSEIASAIPECGSFEDTHFGHDVAQFTECRQAPGLLLNIQFDEKTVLARLAGTARGESRPDSETVVQSSSGFGRAPRERREARI